MPGIPVLAPSDWASRTTQITGADGGVAKPDLGAHYALIDAFGAGTPVAGTIPLQWTLSPQAPRVPTMTFSCAISPTVRLTRVDRRDWQRDRTQRRRHDLHHDLH